MPHYLVGLMPPHQQEKLQAGSRAFIEGWTGPALSGIYEAKDSDTACELAATDANRAGSYFAIPVSTVTVGLKAA